MNRLRRPKPLHHRPGAMKMRTHHLLTDAATLLALSAGLALTPADLIAATLSIRPIDSETLELSLTEDPASYFLLQQTTDLATYYPYAMVLGESTASWNLYPDPETPARFFRARAISVFASEDTDGDGIDDLYEIRHPVLNPLDFFDAALDPDNNSQTYLEEYRSIYNFGDGKREAISSEVSVFTTRPFKGPAFEAISDEVSVFTTRSFTGPTYESISDEVSLNKTNPTP